MKRLNLPHDRGGRLRRTARRGSLLALVVIAVITLGTFSAAAEPAGSPPAAAAAEATAGPTPEEQSKVLYEQGASAYAARKNFEAIEFFRKAYELAPRAPFLYNIGLAYEDAGDARNALRYYRDYLRAGPDPNDRKAVDARIAELEKRLGEYGVQQATVMSTPSGAVVIVDGAPVGVTPLTLELSAGSHQIELAATGYASARATIDMPAHRSTEMMLVLARAPEAAAAPRAAESATPAVRARHGVQPLSWGLLGVGAGSLGGALFFELSRASSEREADRAADPVAAAEARGQAKGKQFASFVLFGVGGAFTVAGGTLLVLDVSGSGVGASESVSARPRFPVPRIAAGCSGGLCGVSLRGRF